MSNIRVVAERIFPWGIALIVGLGSLYLQSTGKIALPQGSKDAYLGGVLSLGGIFTGFMATVKTLMFSLSDKTHSMLRDSGYLSDLTAYLSQALWGSVAVCVTALVLFHFALEPLAASILVAVVTFAFTCVIRITMVTTNLLKTR